MKPNGPLGTVLALNVGSASLKAAQYSLSSEHSARHATVRETGRIAIESGDDATLTPEAHARAQLSALVAGLPYLDDAPDVVVHRIVHGGDRRDPAELTPTELASLETLSTLAPLHQPPALALVRAAIQRWPRARHMGVFDTAWHQTMPERHRVLPISYSLYSHGVKRYGFHGLAFQSAMGQLAHVAPQHANGRIVLAHLGGGSSLCAVREGRCVNTTMGMTPLDGIPMASRPGSLDPGVLLHLQRSVGMSPGEIDRLLWRESGLKGLSGESGDMRKLLASRSDGAKRAIDIYVTRAAQGIAAMAACIGGIDALAFTGGIGMHAAAIRARVAQELAWLGMDIDPALNRSGAVDISSPTARANTFVLPIDEEQEMVQAILAWTFE